MSSEDELPDDFNVRYYQHTSNDFPKFTKPKPIGFYSLNDERQYSPSAQQLRYFHLPDSKQFPLDLSAGIENVQRKLEKDYDEKLEHLLRFIQDNRHKLLQDNKLTCQFVCFRGLLRLLMCTPYERRNNWVLHVTSYRDTIYMHVPDTPESKAERAGMTEVQLANCSYGFKFEQYCVSDSPTAAADASAPVNERSEFGCIFQTLLDDLQLLYAAEMDAVQEKKAVFLDDNPADLTKLKFIELKTRYRFFNAAQRETYARFKTQNWWCQSFLVGIQQIYVGLREKSLVSKIECIQVRSLAVEAERSGKWSYRACAEFLLKFLRHLKLTMANINCPYTVREFAFNAKTGIIQQQQDYTEQTPHSFLPEWYIKMFECKK